MIQVQDVVSAFQSFQELNIERIDDGDKVYQVYVHVKGLSKILNTALWLNYHLEILVPKSFPQEVPETVDLNRELNIYFEHINADRTLCLATMMDLRKQLRVKKPFNKYLEVLLDYLTQYAYWNKYRTYPIVTRSHGIRGVVEAYGQTLNIDDDTIVMKLLMMVPVSNGMRNMQCPCGSGLKFKKCHYHALKVLSSSRLFREQVVEDVRELESEGAVRG